MSIKGNLADFYDNGSGTADVKYGSGLSIMTERVDSVGGVLKRAEKGLPSTSLFHLAEKGELNEQDCRTAGRRSDHHSGWAACITETNSDIQIVAEAKMVWKLTSRLKPSTAGGSYGYTNAGYEWGRSNPFNKARFS